MPDLLGLSCSSIALTALGLVVLQAIRLLRNWDLGDRRDAADFQLIRPHRGPAGAAPVAGLDPRARVPTSWSASRAGSKGSWIIQGDALLAVDMSKAEIKDTDEKARTAIDRPAPSGRPVGARQSREEPAVGHQVPKLDPAGELAPGRPDGHGEAGDAGGTAARRAGGRFGRQQGDGATGRGGHARRVLSSRGLARLGPVEVAEPQCKDPAQRRRQSDPGLSPLFVSSSTSQASKLKRSCQRDHRRTARPRQAEGVSTQRLTTENSTWERSAK